MIGWPVAMLFSGVLLRLFRWLLQTQRPTTIWRFGAHGFALVTALVLSGLVGVGRAGPGVDGFIAGCILYTPAQIAWLLIECWKPNTALTGLA